MRRGIALALLCSLFLMAGGHRPGTAAAQPVRQPSIVFFGDSLTAGLHASDWDTTFRQIVTRNLDGTPDAGRTAAVIQHPLGLMDDALTRLPQVLAARPTLVFVELGHHEVWADAGQIDRFAERYGEVLDQLLRSGAEVIPSTVAWLGYEPGTFQYEASLRITGMIHTLAAERNLPVADLWTATDRHPEYLSTPADISFVYPYRGDDLHLNDRGHAAIAGAFWEAYLTLRAQSPLIFRRSA